MALFLPAATAMPQRPVFSEPLSYPGLQLRIAAMIKQLIVNHAVRRVVSVVIYAGLIGLAMTIA